MKQLYKKYRKMILATIPMAFIISGAAVGAGAGSQGLTMLFTLVISIGSLVYTVIVGNLLLTIEELNKELSTHESEDRKRAQNKRNFNPYV